MNRKVKNPIILISSFIVVFAFAFYYYSPVIFQEGNPLPYIKGILELNFSEKDIILLDSEDELYFTKSKNGKEILSEKLSDEGYQFLEQMGSGYFFKNENEEKLIATHKYYSRFYSIWKITKTKDIKESIEWIKYRNEEYGFAFQYPSLSINNQLWGALPDGISISEVLLPNQVLNKDNSFYLTQKYKINNWETGKLTKIENTIFEEIENSPRMIPWNIVIFEAEDENDLDRVIKEKLGSGCSYKTKIDTNFSENYRVEINGDGKDLGSTNCPVNYANYIIYSPVNKKVAFWSLGQECNIGLGFIYPNCFDFQISESFHFFE
ncbi:hypothetical protein K9M42_02170 [Patescibacteria group bacterium]|nr:hypothetical protein [Patescibacteria group bacterium]